MRTKITLVSVPGIIILKNNENEVGQIPSRCTG